MTIGHVKLGRYGPKVSKICLGTWQIGQTIMRSKGFRYASLIEGYDINAIRNVLRKALDLGINFFDTAESYGSEEFLGKELKGEDVIIATKVSQSHLKYNLVIKACDRSLRKLGSIGVYFIHWPNPEVPLEDTFKAFKNILDEGKAKYFGLSNFRDSPILLEKALGLANDLKVPVVSLQERYNVLSREIEKGILSTARSNNLTLLAYSPLSAGLLSGKYHEKNLPKDSRLRSPYLRPFFIKSFLKKVRCILDALKAIAEETGLNVAQVSLGWILAKENIIPVVACRKVSQLEEVASAPPLSQKYVRKIDKVYESVFKKNG